MDLTATTKSCSACKAIKPHAAFAKNAKEKSGLRPACRECTSRSKKAGRSRMTEAQLKRERKTRQAWYHKADNAQRNRSTRNANYKRDPIKHRLNAIKSHHGLTADEYYKMLEAQDGRCAICKQAEYIKVRGKAFSLAVDHDHVTGEVRGLLCAQCNRALGCFKDDTARMESAIAYLKRHAERSNIVKFNEGAA